MSEPGFFVSLPQEHHQRIVDYLKERGIKCSCDYEDCREGYEVLTARTTPEKLGELFPAEKEGESIRGSTLLEDGTAFFDLIEDIWITYRPQTSPIRIVGKIGVQLEKDSLKDLPGLSVPPAKVLRLGQFAR